MKDKVKIVNGIPTVTYKPWISWYLRVPILKNICWWFIKMRMPEIVMGDGIRGYIGEAKKTKLVNLKIENKHGQLS